jgi:predicted nucleic acid-binding Zn ribbon protein
MEKKICPECGESIKGRADKKFCSDMCRNAYNNKLNSDNTNLIRNVNNILRKNRRIMEELLPEETAKVSHQKLIEKGFHFAESILSTFGKMTGGTLGSALGTAVLSLPLLIGLSKTVTGLFSGGLKSLFIARGTPGNPMIVQMQGVAGGGLTNMLGGGGSQFAGGSYSAGKDIVSKRQGGFMGGFMGKGMAAGLGLGIAGTGLQALSQNMEPGA